MRLLPLLLLAFSVSTLAADPIEVGGQRLEIPPPAGFVAITEAMPLVKRLADQMTDPVNDTLAFYIAEDGVPTALEGNMPPLDRYFILKVNRKLKHETFGTGDFARLRASVAAENRKIFEEIQAKLPELTRQLGSNVSKEFDIDFAIEIAQMLPLDPHLEEDNAFAYSMFINYGTRSGGESGSHIVPATATFLNLSGRLLFLYAYGVKEDLEWTRSASAEWHRALLAANDAPPSGSRTGISWSGVGRQALVGGLIGAVAALLLGLLKKKKRAADGAEAR